MSGAVGVQPLQAASFASDGRATRRLVSLSGAALAAQVVTTDYGAGGTGAAVLWFLLGCLLLWLVYRHHSRPARGFVIVTSLVGAVVYGFTALGDARSAFLALVFLAEAAPLLSRPVRRHVHAAS